jgi:formylglycine-generating enzyme required for sulfatase activity
MRTRRETFIGGLAVLAVILMGSGFGSNCGAIAADSGPQGVVDAGSSAKTMSLDLGGGVKLELVLIPAGTFSMGSDDGAEDERPVHKVAISKPFYIGKYPVTQQQWQAVMGDNPSDFKGPRNPVERVGWLAIKEFLWRLNEKFAATGMKFALPTEAQWEYACRAGGDGKLDGSLADYAWFRDNAKGATHPVGEKKPNAWGLYDMHGNVCQWCTDWYAEDYYSKSPAADPTGGPPGCHHVMRGGCFEEPADYCRTTYRSKNDEADRNHNLGLRVIAVRSGK